MLGAQYSSTTLPIDYVGISFLAVMPAIGSNRPNLIKPLKLYVNYFLKMIFALKEKDLRSPSILNG